MKSKIIDSILISLLTLSTGVTAGYLAPQNNKIITGLCGGTTGLITGISIFRIKDKLEEKIEELGENHQDGVKLNNKGKNISKKKVEIVKIKPIKKLNSEAALNWLKEQNIEVKKYYQPEEGDKIFNEIALYLGDKYNLVQPVYEQLKRHIPKGNSFQVNLSSKTAVEISTATQFCQKLSNYALLNSYNYNNSQKIIYATPPQQGRLINFLNGGWFEKYIFQKVIHVLEKNNLKYSCIVNPQITLSKGNNFELDILFLINDNPLWLECKTGDYQAYIVKYSDFKKELSIGKKCSCLIILGLPDHLSKQLTQLYAITVLNENNFLEYIELLIEGKYEDENEHKQAIITNKNELNTILKKAGIRPLPEIRQEIIREVIKINLPQNLIDIKKEISENLSEVSNNKIQDIINVLLQSGIFLGENKQPIISFKDNVYSLISNDENELEKLCLETYKDTILSLNHGYFESPENVSLFEEVVGNFTK